MKSVMIRLLLSLSAVVTLVLIALGLTLLLFYIPGGIKTVMIVVIFLVVWGYFYELVSEIDWSKNHGTKPKIDD